MSHLYIVLFIYYSHFKDTSLLFIVIYDSGHLSLTLIKSHSGLYRWTIDKLSDIKRNWQACVLRYHLTNIMLRLFLCFSRTLVIVKTSLCLTVFIMVCMVWINSKVHSHFMCLFWKFGVSKFMEYDILLVTDFRVLSFYKEEENYNSTICFCHSWIPLYEW